MSPPHPEPASDSRSRELLLLGQIHGIVDQLRQGQQAQAQAAAELGKRLDGRLDKLDDRLRTVEQKAALNGAVSGGVMGIGVALAIEGLKAWARKGTPTP